MRVIIDADTGNEIDDFYAITRALFAPQLEIVGLTASHFRVHDDAPPDSAAVSHSINEELVRLSGRTDVPCRRGSENWMGKAWGGDEPANSDAVQHIISAARETPAGSRLTLVGQGAMTNIASAIRLAPEIAGAVSVYQMGFRFDVQSGVWNKNEFNVRNDLNAADYLLNQSDLDLHLMIADTCQALRFSRDETFARLDAGNPLQARLLRRWDEHEPEREKLEWIMWDLALVCAVIHPEMARLATVQVPPENGTHTVKVYTSIDATAMKDDFWGCFP